MCVRACACVRASRRAVSAVRFGATAVRYVSAYCVWFCWTANGIWWIDV